MSINQLYGEILGNVTGVTWLESETINYWYALCVVGKDLPPGLTMRVAYIYAKRTMDYRDHIVQGILATF